VKSYHTRRAITPVPAWSGAYDIIAALMPERILAPTRRHVTRGKMLGTDLASREGYQQRLTDIENGESNDAG